MPHQPVTRPRALLVAVLAALALSPAALLAQDEAPVRPATPVSLAPDVAPQPAPVRASSVPSAVQSNGTLPGALAARPFATQAPVALTSTVTRESAADALLLRRQEDSNRTNTTLMIVGAVAVLVGAAVGDDAGTILIVGGAGIGLWGLYRFLN